MKRPKRSAPGREIAGAAKLRLVQSYQFCPHTATHTERMPQAHPHYAREGCTRCGAFIRWLPKPQSVERCRLNAFKLAKLGMCRGLSAWERTFIRSVSEQRKLSPKQLEIIDRIASQHLGAAP